jgi:aminoglycoside phosphotransferase (APT) family kinase protein
MTRGFEELIAKVMGTSRMHRDEVEFDVGLVRRLVDEQVPKMRGFRLRPVRSTGTVNAIFRLGDGFCVRLPRVARWAGDLDKEVALLPMLARQLSLTIPRPVAKGHPTSDYPFPWAVYEWIDGAPYARANVHDEREAARDLARFVSDLRRIEPPRGAPRAGRAPLRELDGDTRDAIAASRHVIDSRATTSAWERAFAAPTWDGSPVWIHTDLLPSNLLVRGGRLHAVIDFGGAGIGDPAADVTPAWAVFGHDGRRVFREALAVDEGTYQRARGYALHQAAMIIPYYEATNPNFVAQAKRTVEEVLADSATEQ